MTGKPTLVPPNDLDAEGAVLSAAMLSPAAFYEAQAFMSEEDFYSDANRWVWRAISELERQGTRYDTVSVAGWLRAHDKLKQVGDTPYLAALTDATPAVAHVSEHAKIVAGHAHARRMISFFQAAAADGYAIQGDPFAWGQEVEARFYEHAHRARGTDEDGTIGVVMPRVVEGIMARVRGEGEETGIPTGFVDLDRRINGWKRGKSYVVAGRPGMGKTAFISQCGTNVARLGMFVVEICTEQKREELALRKLCQATSLPFHVLESKAARKALSRQDIDVLVAKAGELAELPLAVEYMTNPTLAEIRTTIRLALAKLRRKFGDLPLGLVSLDQLQHFNSGQSRDEFREAAVGRMSREIAGMAGLFDCPILLAAQLNREVEKRPDKRPNLSDIRESGALEQDAFGVLFPFRPRYYEKRERGQANDASTEDAELIIAKHKNGPAGSVALTFDPPSMSFEDDGAAREREYAQENLPI